MGLNINEIVSGVFASRAQVTNNKNKHNNHDVLKNDALPSTVTVPKHLGQSIVSAVTAYTTTTASTAGSASSAASSTSTFSTLTSKVSAYREKKAAKKDAVKCQLCCGGEQTTCNAVHFVDHLVAKHQVVIFSKSYCPYCRQVKDLLTREGIAHVTVELDLHEDGAVIQRVLYQSTGQRTVPSVFVNGRHIGGASDTLAKWESGEMSALLKTKSKR
mmetsp:Transcript_19170/g.45367  ORF Transcript_19170/g.45367 Transcript_19170/m.45367 type:complete len:216 (+) Transcript_19170:133-780(+)